MISHLPENYTTGYRKHESMLKRIYDDYIKHYKSVWTFPVGFLILIAINLLINGWISWNEILIRAALGTGIFGVAFILGTGFPKKIISEPFHPDHFPSIIQVMKNHHHITVSKLIRLIISYAVIFIALDVFALMDTDNIMNSFRDLTWKSELPDLIILIIFLSSIDLYRHYSSHSQLKEIEQHIK